MAQIQRESRFLGFNFLNFWKNLPPSASFISFRLRHWVMPMLVSWYACGNRHKLNRLQWIFYSWISSSLFFSISTSVTWIKLQKPMRNVPKNISQKFSQIYHIKYLYEDLFLVRFYQHKFSTVNILLRVFFSHIFSINTIFSPINYLQH